MSNAAILVHQTIRSKQFTHTRKPHWWIRDSHFNSIDENQWDIEHFLTTAGHLDPQFPKPRVNHALKKWLTFTRMFSDTPRNFRETRHTFNHTTKINELSNTFSKAEHQKSRPRDHDSTSSRWPSLALAAGYTSIVATNYSRLFSNTPNSFRETR